MDSKHYQSGYIYAILAYFLWGLSPIFWKQLQHLPTTEILIYRIFCSFIFIWIYILIFKIKIDFKTLKKKWLYVFISSLLLTSNWIIYIFAVNNGFLQDASLGYYINPLISIFLGMLFLKEKLKKAEWAALICAGLGVVYLSIQLEGIPWISFALALSFGTYGLLKKRSSFTSLPGLTMELTFILPILLVFFFLGSEGVNTIQNRIENVSLLTVILIILTGPITIIPLVLFGKSVGRIKLSAIGFLQFIAPTLMLIISILLFKEPFPIEKLPGFIMVWAALIIYIVISFNKTKN